MAHFIFHVKHAAIRGHRAYQLPPPSSPLKLKPVYVRYKQKNTGQQEQQHKKIISRRLLIVPSNAHISMHVTARTERSRRKINERRVIRIARIIQKTASGAARFGFMHAHAPAPFLPRVGDLFVLFLFPLQGFIGVATSFSLLIRYCVELLRPVLRPIHRESCTIHD